MIKLTALITVLTFLPGCVPCLLESFPRVVTPLGTVEGYYKTSNNGRRYEAYEGIPYAQPPIGELRFEVPRPISSWTGVLKTKDAGLPCLQIAPRPCKSGHDVEGTEDCLYLNVYTPARDDSGANETRIKNLSPVIFYIHGGGFQFGSTWEYGPRYLLDRDVTVVTVHYRVGPLGFLSTEDAIVPGNMGLKDQVMAMRWVKDNIESFGGDPSKITLFGHSNGAACVHYHYLTNLTAGLFHGGVSLSGNSLQPWPQPENLLENAKRLATIVGCPTDTVQSMIDCLKSRPGHFVTKASGQLNFWRSTPAVLFGPVVEKGGGEFTFIDRPPIEIITSGQVQDVPWITTVVSEEGLVPAGEFVDNENILKELDDDWEIIAPYLLEYYNKVPIKDHAKVARLIKEHYLGTRSFDTSTVDETIKMLSDRLYLYHTREAARLQAKVNQSPVRFYYFSYRGSYSVTEYMTGTKKNFGVAHEDDLFYVMDASVDLQTTPEDLYIQSFLIDLWVTFAKDGIPDVGIEWPAISRTTDEFRSLHIGGQNDIGIIDIDQNFGNRNFWQSLGIRENVYNDKTTQLDEEV